MNEKYSADDLTGSSRDDTGLNALEAISKEHPNEALIIRWDDNKPHLIDTCDDPEYAVKRAEGLEKSGTAIEPHDVIIYAVYGKGGEQLYQTDPWEGLSLEGREERRLEDQVDDFGD